MKRLLAIICALAALRAGADTLADVKAAVNRLSAKEPVRATFSTEASVKAAGRFANKNTARIASAEVVHDAAGVSITIPQTLLDKASEEVRSRNGAENTAQDAIGSIRSLTIVEALDFRDSLLGMLDNATVSEEKRVAFRNQPARKLVLKLSPRPQKESGGTIRIGTVKTEDRMELWVGGQPAARRGAHPKDDRRLHGLPRDICGPHELHLRAHARPPHPRARRDER